MLLQDHSAHVDTNFTVHVSSAAGAAAVRRNITNPAFEDAFAAEMQSRLDGMQVHVIAVAEPTVESLLAQVDGGDAPASSGGAPGDATPLVVGIIITASLGAFCTLGLLTMICCYSRKRRRNKGTAAKGADQEALEPMVDEEAPGAAQATPRSEDNGHGPRPSGVERAPDSPHLTVMDEGIADGRAGRPPREDTDQPIAQEVPPGDDRSLPDSYHAEQELDDTFWIPNNDEAATAPMMPGTGLRKVEWSLATTEDVPEQPGNSLAVELHMPEAQSQSRLDVWEETRCADDTLFLCPPPGEDEGFQVEQPKQSSGSNTREHTGISGIFTREHTEISLTPSGNPARLSL